MEDTESCNSGVLSSVWNQHRKQRQKIEVFNEVLNRLRELNVPEALVPGFEDHFYRLPTRYALDMNVERAQDVLMHKRLLHIARTLGPAVEVRLVLVVKVCSASAVSASKSLHSHSQSKVNPQDSAIPGNMSFHPPPAFSSSANVELELVLGSSQLQVGNRDSYLKFYAHYARPMHEITISTNDKPKLLSQLTSLMSETGLDIQEAHAFSILDGYSLDVFVVVGWVVEQGRIQDLNTGESEPFIDLNFGSVAALFVKKSKLKPPVPAILGAHMLKRDSIAWIHHFQDKQVTSVTS